MLKWVFCFFLLLPTISYSKTTIDSDKLDVNCKDRIAIFKGNVKIYDDNISFTADMVEVRFSSENIIENIRSKSNTHLINAIIKRDNQTYDLQCQEISVNMIKKIIIAHNATLHHNNSIMTSDKIIYNINNGQMSLSGNKQVKISIDHDSKKIR
jgi:lipopolysaccharide transport protein LptA